MRGHTKGWSSLNDKGKIIQEWTITANVESCLYQFRDFTGQFAFNIKFSKFDSSRRHNIYLIYFKPTNQLSIEPSQVEGNLQDIENLFNRWIDLVVKMHEITEEYYDPYKKFYDDQFAEYFKNDDEDAAINPFEIEKQEIIFYFLTYAEKTIGNSVDITDENKKDLLADLSHLKENVPGLTKKMFVSSLSKFAQKTKKISNKVFHEIFDVLKKEVMKKLLYEAVDHVPNLLRKVESWINLLN